MQHTISHLRTFTSKGVSKINKNCRIFSRANFTNTSHSNMIKIDHIDHLVLTVKDIPTTIAFYTNILGMQEITFGEGRKALLFGANKFNLHQKGKEFEPKALTPTTGSIDICLIVENSIDVVIEQLSVHNVPIVEGPVIRTGAVGKINSVYIRDPDQNLVELSVYC